MILWIAILIAIIIAEVVTAVVSPIWGMGLHAALFVLLIALASFNHRSADRKLCLAISLAPLIRVLSLSMPLVGFAQINWYLIISVPLLAATFVVVRMVRYSRCDIGLKVSHLPLQLLVACTGLVFGLVEYYILSPEPLVETMTLQSLLLPAFILLVATGFTEEVIFRGVMQRSALDVMGGRYALVYVAAVFAALHIGYLSILDVVFVFVVALFFALIVKRTGSLLGVTLSHALTNITLYLVIPLLF